MLVISHQRHKCIGCHACVEAAPDRWQMSKKDGKAVLLRGEKKRGGYFTYKGHDIEIQANQNAAQACPVKIIRLTII